MKVCIDKGTDDAGCCKAWQKGIRTINNQYPDDNREFGILEGTGIVITPETAGIRIACTVPTADTLTAGDNIDISAGGSDELVVSLVSDPVINGDIQVNGDIIQNGSAYETHAEKVYTTNDYIVTRDGAVSALSPGDYSGFQVKKYDGTNDGRLVIDNAGVARVGDVGDEQPLLTRSESAQLNNGDLLQWNSTSQKAVSSSVNTSQIVRGTGNIGSDTKPVKVVNGVAVAVTDNLAIKTNPVISEGTVNITSGSVTVVTDRAINLPANATVICVVNATFITQNTNGTIALGIQIPGYITSFLQQGRSVLANDQFRISCSYILPTGANPGTVCPYFYQEDGGTRTVNFRMSVMSIQ